MNGTLFINDHRAMLGGIVCSVSSWLVASTGARKILFEGASTMGNQRLNLILRGECYSSRLYLPDPTSDLRCQSQIYASQTLPLSISGSPSVHGYLVFLKPIVSALYDVSGL